jgi:hypothetical protein
VLPVLPDGRTASAPGQNAGSRGSSEHESGQPAASVVRITGQSVAAGWSYAASARRYRFAGRPNDGVSRPTSVTVACATSVPSVVRAVFRLIAGAIRDGRGGEAALRAALQGLDDRLGGGRWWCEPFSSPFSLDGVVAYRGCDGRDVLEDCEPGDDWNPSSRPSSALANGTAAARRAPRYARISGESARRTERHEPRA